jgi:hypothetical protein
MVCLHCGRIAETASARARPAARWYKPRVTPRPTPVRCAAVALPSTA